MRTAAAGLAVTGTEAPYADMGHLGRKAITHGRLGLVLLAESRVPAPVAR